MVEGFTAPGGLAPIVVAAPRSCRWDAAACPCRAPPSASSLATGSDDCRRVEISGIVRSVRRVGRREPRSACSPRAAGCWSSCSTARAGPPRFPSPTLACGCEECAGRASTGTGSSWARRCSWASRPTWWWRRRRSQVAIRRARASRPGPAPGRARSGARPSRPRQRRRPPPSAGPAPLPARRRQGRVVAETDQREPLAPGDRVDVVGFPRADGSGPRLEDASYRPAGHGRPRHRSRCRPARSSAALSPRTSSARSAPAQLRPGRGRHHAAAAAGRRRSRGPRGRRPARGAVARAGQPAGRAGHPARPIATRERARPSARVAAARGRRRDPQAPLVDPGPRRVGGRRARPRCCWSRSAGSPPSAGRSASRRRSSGRARSAIGSWPRTPPTSS